MQKTAVQGLIACQLHIQNILQMLENIAWQHSWKAGKHIGGNFVDSFGDEEKHWQHREMLKQEFQAVISDEFERRRRIHISSHDDTKQNPDNFHLLSFSPQEWRKRLGS